MNEAFDVARTLKESPDLFPWVILGIVLVIMFKERVMIREFFKSIIDSRKETTVFHAQQNELIRNNTAALQNNTAMLEILKKDRHNMEAKIEHHEKLSEERIAHMQTVVNRIDKTVRESKEDISIILDRTKKQ